MSRGYRRPDVWEEIEVFCRDCRCWYSEYLVGDDGIKRLAVSECRRDTPRPDTYTGTWPKVSPGEWCGEWRA